MSIFAIEKFEAVRKDGKVSFYKLYENGKCLLDKFYNEIQFYKKSLSDFKSILATMDYMAETNELLPKQRFNSIKERGKVIGYEFKKNDIRIYCIKPMTNVVILFGGYKKNQKNDIKKMQAITKEIDEIIDELITIKR